MKLGIDFGTTRTVVAAVLGGRHAVVSFDDGEAFRAWLPGLAASGADGPVYGWEAAARLSSSPRCGVRSIKRRVGALAPDDVVDELGLTALELLTGFLAHLRAQIEGASNLELSKGEILEALVAVPANATTRQRYLTLEAFRRAGFEVLGLINEPTAAAIEYGHRNARALSPRSPKTHVAVYDLGGGTFDAAAVSLRGQRFELLATDGVARLGGDDFDEVLLGLALSRADLAESEPGLRPALLEVCREAKEGLSARSRNVLVELSAVLDGVEDVVVPAADLYAACEPLVERTVGCVDRVLASLGDEVETDDARGLGAVYLVGGAAAFPAVARRLREAYGRKLQLAPEPFAATAIGLAVAADPDASVFVRESVTRHFGVWREGDEGREKIFDPILSKDTEVPDDGDLVLQRSYRPAHRVGHLRFLESSALTAKGQPAGDITPLSEILFPYDPALADGAVLDEASAQRTGLRDELIVETYTYARDGRLSVQIENRTRGYQRTYRLGELR